MTGFEGEVVDGALVFFFEGAGAETSESESSESESKLESALG